MLLHDYFLSMSRVPSNHIISYVIVINMHYIYIYYQNHDRILYHTIYILYYLHICPYSLNYVPSTRSNPSTSSKVRAIAMHWCCARPWIADPPTIPSPYGYGKSPFLLGKSTISMAIFNSFLYVYQRVVPLATQFLDQPRIGG